MMKNTHRLDSWPRSRPARVTGLQTDDQDLLEGLQEQGFLVGAVVEVLEKGMFGGTPISVRVGRAIVAVRAREAQAVEVGEL
jgi:Fe2+ transport system protein FeoA